MHFPLPSFSEELCDVLRIREKKENRYFKSCDGKIAGNFEITATRLLEIENVLTKKNK